MISVTSRISDVALVTGCQANWGIILGALYGFYPLVN